MHTYPLYRIRLRIVEIIAHAAPYIAARLRFVRPSSITRFEQLDTLPEGSLGWVIAAELRRQSLHPLEHSIRHDIRHAVFGYAMNTVGEVRLQACILGNRRYKWHNLLFLTIAVAMLPELWRWLPYDYLKGRTALSLDEQPLESRLADDLMALRQEWHVTCMNAST